MVALWGGWCLALEGEWCGLLHYATWLQLVDWRNCHDVVWLGWMWRLKIPEKVRLTICLLFHNSLPTNKLQLDRKMAPSPSCLIFGSDLESGSHALFVCPWTAAVWKEYNLHPLAAKFGSITIFYDSSRKALGKCGMEAYIIMWVLWKERNKRATSNTVRQVMEVIKEVRWLIDALKEGWTSREVRAGNL